MSDTAPHRAIFEGWIQLPFPPPEHSLLDAPKACVYVWRCGNERIPFYVGQSERFAQRIENDYRLTRKRGGARLKKFNAPTDFCIAEAIHYLAQEKGHSIEVIYKQSLDNKAERKREEKKIIRSLVVEGRPLLNCFPRFKPSETSEEEERVAVQNFCEMICRRI